MTTSPDDAHEPPCGDCSTVRECPEPECSHEAKQARYAARRAEWVAAYQQEPGA